MSEPVAGKNRWTPAVGSAVPCGSASPVCYLISVLGAARRFACENRREPDLGFRCGSASPVCYLISVLGAARRFQRGALDFSNLVLGAARRSEPDWNRDRNRDLGFGCGSASPVCSPISGLSAARRFRLENRGELDIGFRCGSALEQDVCRACWIQL